MPLNFNWFGLDCCWEEIVFAVATFGAYSAASRVAKYDSIADNIISAPRLTVGPELGSVLNSENGTGLPYAVITGRVYPQDPSKVLRTANGIPVVISKNTEESRTAKNELSPGIQHVPFVIGNLSAASASPDGPLIMVDDVTSENINGLLLKGHSLGTESKEDFLPVGTVITVLGQVTKLSGEGPAFRIGKTLAGDSTTPFILTRNHITEVKIGAIFKSGPSLMLAIALSEISVVMVYFLWIKWSPRFRCLWRKLCIRAQPPPQGNVVVLPGIQTTCVVCLANPRNLALRPCGHVCVCSDCFQQLNNKCPVCNVDVTESFPVFLS